MASTAANVTVTNVPLPAIALTAPANDADYAAPAAINLAAGVTANGHTITAVQFYNGTNLLRRRHFRPLHFYLEQRHRRQLQPDGTGSL